MSQVSIGHTSLTIVLQDIPPAMWVLPSSSCALRAYLQSASCSQMALASQQSWLELFSYRTATAFESGLQHLLPLRAYPITSFKS